MGIDIAEVLLERDLRILLRDQVDPDEAITIDLGVAAIEAVLILVKVHSLVPWGLCQLAVETVRPSVVSAGQDFIVTSTFLLNDWVGTVPAYIVERVDGTCPVPCNDDVVACEAVTKPVASLLKA